jgi:hypothetical protein
MTAETHVGKFAVNENGQLGYIVEQHTLGSQIAYTGIPISDAPIWISLNPQIIAEKPCPGALMDIVMEIAPPNKVFGKMTENKDLNIPSGHINIQGANFGGPPDWVSFSFNPEKDLKDFFNYLKPNNPMKPPESDDFKIDTNEADDEDVD